MNNVFVYCELEDGKVADVSLELLTKGRKLADDLKCQLEALVIGSNLKDIEKEIFPYGADVVHIADDKRLEHYTTAPHTSITVQLFEEEKPQIALM
ncbi:MAG: electron transfer flavoprotein subunit alpha, partial [Bacteroidota bacterium]